MAAKPADVDAYLATLPDHARAAMASIRSTIHAAVPDVIEAISYQMPTFRVDGSPLIHVAAWKKHIGMYPVPDADDGLLTELAPFTAEKGTLRFPLDEPMPLALIERVVLARRAQLGG